MTGKDKRKNIIKKNLNHVAGLFGSIEKKVTFLSFNGRHYSDNPRAISEKMHELYPEYKLVWGCMSSADRSEYPEYVEVYSANTFQYRRALATSVAFVNNEAMKEDLYKQKDQLYIQTWHGDRGIKKILYDSLEARGIDPSVTITRDQYVTDLFVVGSDYAEKRIKTAFRYNGPVLKTGCPRHDCLLAPRNGDAVRAALGVEPGKKILLYAPTLRRNDKVVEGRLDIDDTLEHLRRRGGEWVCLVRAHPKSLGLDVHAAGNMIDVSAWPDIADLLMIADFLITDYSSCAGDFILREKPVLLAQFDLEQYMEEDRNFHVNIADTGFIIARDQRELDGFIDNMTDEQFAANCRQIMAWFGTCETGHAAEDVCRLIDEHYQKTHSLKRV